MASGWPVRVDLVQSSGDSEFDTKARGAILSASPLHDAQETHFEGLRNFRVVLNAVPSERGQTKSDDYPALKHFQQDIEARVGSVVSEQDYPRDARERGWQGLTIVRVTIGQDGRLKSVTVVRSSRFAVLDERAVAKMQEVQLPKVPAELAGREFSVDVPLRVTLGACASFSSRDSSEGCLVPRFASGYLGAMRVSPPTVASGSDQLPPPRLRRRRYGLGRRLSSHRETR